jgi:hypothetical protein
MTSSIKSTSSLKQERLPAVWTWYLAFTAIAALFVWSIFSPAPSSQTTPQPSPIIHAGAPATGASLTQTAAHPAPPLAIEISKIRPGMRVQAFNPEVTDEERASWEQVDYKNWFALSILLIGEQGEPIPPGRVVTGTFSHRVKDVMNLHVQGLDKPIGVTGNHPFWSEDRQQFVQAATLQPGERLRSMVGGPNGGIAHVTSITPRGPPGSCEFVHNLEVECEHAYQITEQGLIVHNVYKEGNIVIYGAVKGLGKIFQKHHAVLDKWAKANIPGYISGAAPTILMTISNHKKHSQHITNG